MRRFLIWLAITVQMGRLNPWLLGLAIGRIPHRVDD